MRDWKRFLERRLALPEMEGRRELRMISELADHLEEIYREAISHGASEAEAEATAEECLGDACDAGEELVRSEPAHRRAQIHRWITGQEEGLRGNGGRWSKLADFLHDTRVAWRTLRKRPLFTAVTVISLAIGIGANTALFTIVQVTWLEPVPGIEDADRVVEVLLSERRGEMQEWTFGDFQDVREVDMPIEALAGWKPRDGTLTTKDGSQSVRVMYVSVDYFRVLGVTPAKGRAFLPSEDVNPGGHPVTVLSHAMWRQRLGGDPKIVGQTIILNRSPYTVVGIAPEAFRGHQALTAGPDLWVPLMQHPLLAGERSLLRDRETHWVQVLGRLRVDVTTGAANAALQTVFARLEREFPESNAGRGARAVPFGPVPALGRTQSLMGVGALAALAGLVLLIICGNVAGMVLARSATREREIAVRMALGSGRGRLVRLLMVEALLLAVAGGGLGVLLAIWGLEVGTPASWAAAAPDLSFEPSGVILAFSLALTLGTTLVFGLLPAVRFSRPDMVASLKDDAGGGARSVSRVHRLAASAQTGVALLLLVVCSLFLRALGVMDRRDLGFEPQGLLVTRMDLSLEGYSSPEEGMAFLERLSESLGSLPAVESVALADGLPLDLIGNFTSVSRADRDDETGGRVTVEFTRAGEGFFQTVGMPILRGRGFESTDLASSEPVAVITQALAQRLWPGEEALGRRILFSLTRDPGREVTVVGVVSNVASSRATEQWPHVFAALRQNYQPRVTVVVRGAGDAAALVKPIRSAIVSIDPTLSIPEVITSQSLVARSTESQRLTARAAGGLGLLALLLSAIGVYGVVAFAVTNRTREIGLRIALGATRARVLGAVFEDAVRLAVPGLVVGAVLAAGTAATMRSMLFGLSPVDPLSFGSSFALLLLVVLLASLMPARRASGIDPMEALRAE